MSFDTDEGPYENRIANWSAVISVVVFIVIGCIKIWEAWS